MNWKRDRWLWAAVVLGVVLRIAPRALWPWDSCVRDECTYMKLATRMADGEGMTASAGWLWAPGWPFLMGIFKVVTGYSGLVVILSIVVAAANSVLLYQLAHALFSGLDKRVRRTTGRVAAWMYAISVHQVFFAQRTWSEVFYTGVLLTGLLLFVRARAQVEQSGARPALAAAAMLGGCVGVMVLFRGVAQYMLPVFVVGLVWGRLRRGIVYGQAVAMLTAAVVVVAPYSIHATVKHDSFVLSDRTLGQMMWLGNNDFEPIGFDYGNGQISQRAFNRTKKKGRPKCAKRSEAMELDACQVEAGKQFILDDPKLFVSRMPMRVAQMLTPHSLLTRHIRWHRYQGLGILGREVLVLMQVIVSLVVMLVGAFGLTTRGRGGRGVVISGILLYHVAAIAALAGISRYRVPLEPMLMLYAGVVFADWRGSLAALREGPLRWRLVLTVLTLAVLLPLVLWNLPAGWPEWRHW